MSSSRDLPNSGTEPGSATLQADSLLSEPPGKPAFNISLTESDEYRSAQSVFQSKVTVDGKMAKPFLIFMSHHLALRSCSVILCWMDVYRENE